jgi:hypothetical protein
MDGIMQAPGGPTEDPTNGFKFGDCAIAYFDDVGAEEIDRLFRNLDLLLGRKTYEIFAGMAPSGRRQETVRRRLSSAFVPADQTQRLSKWSDRQPLQARRYDQDYPRAYARFAQQS